MARLTAVVVGLLLLGSPCFAQIEGGVVVGGVSGVIGPQTPPRDTPPARPGTATLRGRITAADTGQPLRKAQVSIFRAPPVGGGTLTNPINRISTTDADGRYEFTKVVAGRYTVSAQKGGYVNGTFGQNRPTDPVKPVVAIDGQMVDKVDISLQRGGVITGRILDEFGEPAIDVQVSAVRSTNARGQRRIVNAGRPSTTNDIGEFRLSALPPGEYFVFATLRNLNPLAETDDRVSYAPTYYPGTAEVSAAQALTVGVGQTINDLTLPLVLTRTARIMGTAVDSAGRPVRGNVQAVPHAAIGLPLALSPGRVNADGSFTISGLAPGDYTLQVQVPVAPGTTESEFASTVVTVPGADDVTGINMMTAKPSTLSGRLVIRAGGARSLVTTSVRLAAQAAPIGGTFFFTIGPVPPPAAANADGSFQIKSRAGAMRLIANGLTPPWTVNAVRYRGADVTDEGIEVRPNEDIDGLEVEITDRVTEVSGLVTNGRGEPVKASWVVLFARDRDKWKPGSRYVRLARADEDARFKVVALPPGDYLTFATETDDPGDLTGPAILDRMQNRAANLSLREAEVKTIDLKLASLP